MHQEELKQYFWYIFGVLGVVFFWIGIWDGVGRLYYLKNPWISLAIGLAMFALSKKIFKEGDGSRGERKPVESILQNVYQHPQKHEFHIKYIDHLRNKHYLLHAKNLHRLEKGFAIFLDKGKELFVPMHRVVEVLHKGKTHWKV